MNLPNALTLSRIFIVPLLVVVLLTPLSENLGVPRYILALAIFVAASLTDYFDGKIARRRKQVSKLGKLLDPIADKLLISAALISLVENHLAPAWAVVIIVGREFAVTALRTLGHARGVPMPASPLSKIKMLSQVVAILALILGKDHLHGFIVIGQVALWVCVVTALLSAADYFRRFGYFLTKTTPSPDRP